MQYQKTFKYVIMGVMLGLSIILTRYVSGQFNISRISLGFAPICALAILFGWREAAIVAGLSDFLGYVLYSQGMVFHPGITIVAVLSGLIYGLFFYKKNLTDYIIIKTVILVGLVQLVLNSLWLSQIISGEFFKINFQSYITVLLFKIPQFIAMTIISFITIKNGIIKIIGIYIKNIKKLPSR